jgi:peptidoglycan hydrolase CwlO-like protein
MDTISLLVGATTVIIPLTVYVIARSYSEFKKLKVETKWLRNDYDSMQNQISRVYDNINQTERDIYRAIDEFKSKNPNT